MSQYLPYENLKFDNNIDIETILNTAYDSEIGYFVEVDLIYPDEIKDKTKNNELSILSRESILSSR